VASLVVSEAERAGHLDDDRPELALAELRRWCDGEGSPDAVIAALDQVAEVFFEHRAASAAAWCVLWACRVQSARRGREAEVHESALARAREALMALGADADEARARVALAYSAGASHTLR
jgi:hypothetical protein